MGAQLSHERHPLASSAFRVSRPPCHPQEPGNAEEEAVLLIERSKESRNPAIKRDLLVR